MPKKGHELYTPCKDNTEFPLQRSYLIFPGEDWFTTCPMQKGAMISAPPFFGISIIAMARGAYLLSSVFSSSAKPTLSIFPQVFSPMKYLKFPRILKIRING